MAEFIRPGMPDVADPMSESLAALAAGMTAGRVYKIASVWCPHRKRVVLQQIHDRTTTIQPTTNGQIQDDHDQAWAQLGKSSTSIKITINIGPKEITPCLPPMSVLPAFACRYI